MATLYNPNYYMQDLQAMKDRIDRTMQQYQQNQYAQPQQAPQIHQNFQIAPQQTQNPNDLQSSYVNNVDEVRNIFTSKNGVFVNKDLSTLWFKDTEGKIRIFSLIEIIEKDKKDIEIDNLKKQIEEMKSLILQQNQQVSKPVVEEEPKVEKKTTKK